MIPSGLCNDGLGFSDYIIQSSDVLSGSPPTPLTLTYNTSVKRQTQAEVIEAQWEAYNEVGEVTLESLEWSVFEEARQTQNFYVIRFGWSLDANNPISFLKVIFDSTGYTSTEYENIVAALEQAQEDALAGTDYLSLDEFLDYADRLHSIIINQGLAIPLYEY